MKPIKLFLLILVSGVLFSSCSTVNDDILDRTAALDELMSSYDLWYVDIHRTTGNGDVPFISMAFTMSFINGTMYANNNITDIGFTGNGLGIIVGDYSTFDGLLETNHEIDGLFNFEVAQLSSNEIRLFDISQNVSYVLVGYQRNNFDYDMLFYDNIEYFIQEYNAWERTAISTTGVPNPFDNEHYLQFTALNNTTFYSSHDPFGTDIDQIFWDFVGSYQVFDVVGFNDLKVLTLSYDGGDVEEFELSVTNDQTIELFHISSETIYQFTGRGFIQLLRNEKNSKSFVRNDGRKRTKIERQAKERHKKN